MNIRTLRRMYFGDEDITLTGYPMVIDEGNGGVFNTEFTVSINAQSKEQEAIWDMIKYLLSEDYQRKMRFTLPVNRAAMEKKIDIDEHNVTFAAFGEVFIGELESWESDIFRDYIEGIRTCYYYDYKVHDILMEEAEKMLAGDQSPQECADMMQSRVSIYLSEQS
jgi:ABC-type glycerol-3-phosphate transport system substrate-binding protein